MEDGGLEIWSTVVCLFFTVLFVVLFVGGGRRLQDMRKPFGLGTLFSGGCLLFAESLEIL